MGKQSRRYQLRKTPLHLETFERRNLLSGIHPVPDPWLSSLLSSAPVIGPINVGTVLTPATLHEVVGHGHGKDAVEALLHLFSTGSFGNSSTGSNFSGLLNMPTGHANKAHSGPDSKPNPKADKHALDKVDHVSTAVTPSDTGSQSDTITGTVTSDPSQDETPENSTLTASASTDDTGTASNSDSANSVVQDTSPSSHGSRANSSATLAQLTSGKPKNHSSDRTATISGAGVPSDASADNTPEAPTSGTSIGSKASDGNTAARNASDGSFSGTVTDNSDAFGDSSVAHSGQNDTGESDASGSSTPASLAGGVGQGTPGSVRVPSARDASPTAGRDAARSRTDEVNPAHPSSSTATTAGIGEARTTDNPASMERANALGGRQDYAAMVSVSFDGRTGPMPFNRQVSSPESSPSDHIEVRGRTALVTPASSEKLPVQGPALVPHSEDADEGSMSGVARGAGLLGSPMPFDLDSLSQEAQQFLEQVDALGQDLASLLARMNLSPWAVAAAVTATAIAVARRRSQRAQRAAALNGCAFGGSSGLGAALDLSTVLTVDRG